MKKLLLIPVFIMCCSNITSKSSIPKKSQSDIDCVEFIQLHSAETLAEEFGKSTMWVLRNHKINIWSKTTKEGKFPKSGEMHPGSNARLIKRSGDDYYVQSPLDNSKGWINDIQVKGTTWLNPETFEECSK